MRLETVSVIGGGAWGTALAQAAAMAGRKVSLVARDAAQVDEINASRTNVRYLGSQPLHPAISQRTLAQKLPRIHADFTVDSLNAVNARDRAPTRSCVVGSAPWRIFANGTRDGVTCV